MRSAWPRLLMFRFSWPETMTPSDRLTMRAGCRTAVRSAVSRPTAMITSAPSSSRHQWEVIQEASIDQNLLIQTDGGRRRGSTWWLAGHQTRPAGEHHLRPVTSRGDAAKEWGVHRSSSVPRTEPLMRLMTRPTPWSGGKTIAAEAALQTEFEDMEIAASFLRRNERSWNGG